MKKFIATLLSAGLTFTMLTNSISAYNGEKWSVCFLDKVYSASGYYIVDNVGNITSGNKDNYNLRIDAANQTVEINSIDVTTANKTALFKTDAEVSLIISGKNSYSCTADSTVVVYMAGIVCEGKGASMNISGSGSLDMDLDAEKAPDIYVYGLANIDYSDSDGDDFKIKGASETSPLSFNLELNGGYFNRAIYSDYETVVIENAEISADITMPSYIFATGGYGIYTEKVSITNSDLDFCVSSDNTSGVYDGIMTSSLISNNSTIDVDTYAHGSAGIYVYPAYKEGYIVDITKSDINVVSHGQNSAGAVLCTDKMTITDSVIEAGGSAISLDLSGYNETTSTLDIKDSTLVAGHNDIPFEIGFAIGNYDKANISNSVITSAIESYAAAQAAGVDSLALSLDDDNSIALKDSSITLVATNGISYFGTTNLELDAGSSLTMLVPQVMFVPSGLVESSVNITVSSECEENIKVMYGKKTADELQTIQYDDTANIYNNVSITDFNVEDLLDISGGIIRFDNHKCLVCADNQVCTLCEKKYDKSAGHMDIDKNGICDSCKHIVNLDVTIKAPVATKDLASDVDTSVSSVSGDLTWSPADKTAAYDTAYTAKVVLSDDNEIGFADEAVITVNGKKANVTIGDNKTATVTYKFDKTESEPAPSPKPTTITPTPTPTPVAHELNVGDFINRCYEVALGRKADESGYNYWVDSLNNGEACGAQVGFGFIFSEEYTNKNRSNEEFVNDMYAMYFGREADEAGFIYWVEQLNNETATREDIMAGFANSEEFYNLCSKYGVVCGTYLVGVPNNQQGGVNCFVARLYKVCLNRLPDQAGQAGWVQKLMNGEATGSSCSYGFVFSPEFIILDLDNTDFVKHMYSAFFGREADEGGLNYWVEQLDEQTISREDVFAGFSGSPEFINLCASYGINA